MLTLGCTLPPRMAAVRVFTRPSAETARPMPLEALETPEAFVLFAELPGLTREDIEVQVEREEVRIRARREPSVLSDAKSLLSERHCGPWERRLALPQAVAPDQAEARYTNGVLELRLPKVQAEPSRRLTVN